MLKKITRQHQKHETYSACKKLRDSFSLHCFIFVPFIYRETGAPKQGYGSVLPRHNPDHNKHYLESTHRSDYTPPDKDYEPVPVSMESMKK